MECAISHSSSFQELLVSIKDERKRAHSVVESGSGFELVPANDFWKNVFSTHFDSVDGVKKDDDIRDDMLFFVKKVPTEKRKLKTLVEVFRRESQKKPKLTDVYVDWEETVYLNLILQQFVYTVTVAVCTRTGNKELQILKKMSQQVYPSPSKRQMDRKGVTEEISYPHIFFSVDNFEEVFSDMVVRDSEMVCVEMVCHDKYGELQGVLFLGSIRYDALKKVYDSRMSVTSRWAQSMSLGWWRDSRRVEFVRMRGPQGKGHAEMAVSRVRGSGMETPQTTPMQTPSHTPLHTPAQTPDSEAFPSHYFDDQSRSDSEGSKLRESFGSLLRGSRRNIRKSRSEAEHVDPSSPTGPMEVDAAHLADELAEHQNSGSGWMGYFGQTWHLLKERRRAQSTALNSYLTYVTLPWHRIIADILEVRSQPILTF